MKKLWFKAKRYGWGWYPATWQGWLVLAVWLVLYLWIFRNLDAESDSARDILISVIVPAVVITCVLIYACYLTGEKPRWRWGSKD